MSDGSLSQDEIDALLQGSGGMDFDDDSPGAGSELSADQIKQFAAIINGTVDSQGSNFSMLVNSSVSMDTPKVAASRSEQLLGEIGEEVVQVKLNYNDGVSGEHIYLMSSEAAIAIAGPMMGQEGVDLDDAALNALQEALSQIHGPVSTAIGEAAGETIMTAAPDAQSIQRDSLDLPAGSFARVDYPVAIDGSQYTITEVFSSEVVEAVAKPAQASQPQQQTQPAGQAAAARSGMQGQQGGGMAAMGGGGGEDPMASMFGSPASGTQMGGSPGVQSVQFPNLQGGQGSGEQGNISLLMDVYMEMTVELGRTRKLIKEILGMGEGTIIELDKLAGEPVDILVNHKLIAKGEVVVIDENFGVRVTEIVSPMERVSNMS